MTRRSTQLCRRWVMVVCVLWLAGCATVEQRAFRHCPMEADEGWHFLSAPPVAAAEILALAKPEPAPRFSLQRVRLYWFENAAGHILLCRTVLDHWGEPGCGATEWEFWSEGWSVASR